MRVANWDAKWVEAVGEASTKTFNWGTHDCVTFAADAVQAITGKDLIVDLRGKWDSALSARRVIKKMGGFTTAISSRLGQPLETPRLARTGDVVLTYEGFLAVVVLAYAVAPKPSGLLRVEMDRWITGWRVG